MANSLKSIQALELFLRRILNTLNEAQVEIALLDVNVNKSCGHDMLPPRLVRESAGIANILNTSIEQGC